MSEGVAVVVTTHYRNSALREAIESALAQTHDPVEVVVVDDSGERNAEPVAAEYDVRYRAHDENRGQVAGWETGLDATDTTYVQFLDDDDLLSPSKLARQVAVLESDPAVGVVYCGVNAAGRDGRPEPAKPGEDARRGDVLDRALCFDMWPCYTTSMLVDRECLEAVRPLIHGPNRTDLRLMIELAKVTAFDYVDETLVTQRVVDDRQRERDSGEHLRIIEDYCHLASGQVWHRMLHRYHRIRCSRALDSHLWSPRAVQSGALACYHMLRSGRLTPSTFGFAAASLFGHPGYRLARVVRDAVLSGEGRLDRVTER